MVKLIIAYIIGSITGFPIFMIVSYFISVIYHKIIGDYNDWSYDTEKYNKHRGRN